MLDRARAAGVARLMIPGLDLESSRQAVVLADRFAEVYAAVGFHPHEAARLGEPELEELRSLAQHPKVKAIGEIGLDYYRNLSPPEAQRRAFRRQLDLAAELALPVIIHSREAHADVLATLREWALTPGARGVLHSYSGDRTQLPEVFQLGFYIGLTGPITFPKAAELRAVAQAAPLEKILLETDAPYLTPAPHRGRRNEPAYVKLTAEKVAEVRGLSYEIVTAQTGANAAHLFDWEY